MFWRKLISYGALAAVHIYIILLFIQGKLGFYIHPRYHLFTFIATIVSLCIIIITFVIVKKEKNNTTPSLTRTLLIAIIAITGLSFPARPLSTATVNQQNLRRPVQAGGFYQSEETCSLLKLNSSPETISAWNKLFAGCKKEGAFDNQPIEVIGYIRPTNEVHNFYGFSLNRLVISCCAIDARPASILVSAPEWRKSYKDNQWVRVSGMLRSTIVTRNGEKKSEYVITDAYITQIQEPEYPYEYL